MTSSNKMDKVFDARRRNLLELIDRLGGHGAIATIAKRLGHSWPGFVSQMKAPATRSGHRVMSEETARALEAAFSLPPYSFDTFPLPPEGASAAPRAPATHGNAALTALVEAADRAGVVLPADKVTAALAAMTAAGRVDEAYADLVVSLMK